MELLEHARCGLVFVIFVQIHFHLKKLLLIAPLALLLTSCSVLKRNTSASPDNSSTSSKPKQTNPVFIENISLKNGNTSQTVSNNKAEGRSISASQGEGLSGPELNVEQLQLKYAILLDVPVENMQDFRLMNFLESWYGTKYRMGGTDSTGIDCSAFVQTFMSSLYNINLPRTSKEQYMVSGHIIKRQLQEGDLVFFKTVKRKAISHVGIYLGNNKFAHASTSNGVTISDLSEEYYNRTFAGAGRVIGLLQ